jgi:hypothetical protein
MFDLPFKYEWVTLKREGMEYTFPKDPSPFLPGKVQPYPGVYRWKVTRQNSGEPKLALIGESGNLRTRLNQYIKPNNPKMRHWNELFRREIRRGARIECQTLSFESFTIRGACVSPDGVISSPFIRVLVENLMLMLSPEEMDVIVLNKDRGKDCWTRRS